MKSEKAVHIMRFIAFVLIFCTLFLVAETLTYDERSHPPAWRYIRSEEAEHIDVLVVGNSHARNSIDTEQLSRSLNINARTLAFSSSNGQLTATDFEIFLKYSVPDMVILEMCPFMTDNYDEMRHSSQGIVYAHFDGIPDLRHKFSALCRSLEPADVPGGMFQILRPAYVWSRLKAFAHNSGIIAEPPPANPYGFEALSGVLTDPAVILDEVAVKYSDYQPGNSSLALCPENLQAINRIIELSEEYGFELWFYAAPVAYFADFYAEQIDQIYKTAEQSGQVSFCDNFLSEYELLGLAKEDFFDYGHLNNAGAAKFTAYIEKLFAERTDYAAAQ